MKRNFLGLLFVLLVSAPLTSLAADDITVTTRSESEIAAQLATIAVQLERIRDLLSAAAAESQSGFEVKVDGSVLISKSTFGMTKASAQAQCEAVAYNTAYMWKLVTCTFAGETLYQDVFIAG